MKLDSKKELNVQKTKSKEVKEEEDEDWSEIWVYAPRNQKENRQIRAKVRFATSNETSYLTFPLF